MQMQTPDDGLKRSHQKSETGRMFACAIPFPNSPVNVDLPPVLVRSAREWNGASHGPEWGEPQTRINRGSRSLARN